MSAPDQAPVLARGLGADALGEHSPTMGSEDFAELGAAGIPSAILWVGAAPDAATARAAREGRAPGTVRTGAALLAISALELLAPASLPLPAPAGRGPG